MPPEHPVRPADELAAAATAAAPAGEALLAGARDQLARWQLDARIRIPVWTDGRYSRHTDPASGLPSLRADFFSAASARDICCSMPTAAATANSTSACPIPSAPAGGSRRWKSGAAVGS